MNSITELDQLADALVAQDRINVVADASQNSIPAAARSLRAIAAEEGGRWAPLDSEDGEAALADAISAIR